MEREGRSARRTWVDLYAYPLLENAQGKTFFDKSPGYLRIKRAFRQLVDDPGLGVLTAEAGVGKTAALRNLCAELPRPDHLVLYLCDTSVSPLDLYRTLAGELASRGGRRRRAARRRPGARARPPRAVDSVPHWRFSRRERDPERAPLRLG